MSYVRLGSAPRPGSSVSGGHEAGYHSTHVRSALCTFEPPAPGPAVGSPIAKLKKSKFAGISRWPYGSLILPITSRCYVGRAISSSLARAASFRSWRPTTYPRAFVLVLRVMHAYPQAGQNGSATERERDTRLTVSRHRPVVPTSPANPPAVCPQPLQVALPVRSAPALHGRPFTLYSATDAIAARAIFLTTS
jgi:hypothetical protein